MKNDRYKIGCEQRKGRILTLALPAEVETPSPPAAGGEGRGEEGRWEWTHGVRLARYLSPHPNPLPVRRGEGESYSGLRAVEKLPVVRVAGVRSPSPRGEGRGEGGTWRSELKSIPTYTCAKLQRGILSERDFLIYNFEFL